MRRFIAFVFIICLLSFPVSIYAEESDFISLENRIRDSFSQGDYKSMLSGLKMMLLKYPCSPASLVYYHDIPVLMNYCGDQDAVRFFDSMKKSISAKKATDGIYNLLLFFLEEKYYYSINPEIGKSITEKLYPVRNWKVCGPFLKFGKGDENYPFTPESALSFSELKGSKSIKVKNLRGNVNLKDYIYPRKGTGYALTSIRVKAKSRIRIYNNGAYSFFINGRKVITNAGDEKKNCRIIKIAESGEVTLLFKLFNPDAWNFRVIITDDKNNPVSAEIEKSRIFSHFVSTVEVMDPPFNNLKNKSEMSELHLGIYFDDLNSPLAVNYYKKAVKKKNDAYTRYLLARFMINESGRTDSAGYLCGWQKITEIFRNEPLFIPAKYVMFNRLADENEIEAVFSISKDLNKNKWNHVPLWTRYLQFLINLGYEKEFIDGLEQFRKIFPYSVYPLIVESGYYKTRNRDKYQKICKVILSKSFSGDIVTGLADSYVSDGYFQKAYSLLEKYNFDSIYSGRMAELLIRMKDYKNAKKMIFTELNKNESPFYYYLLGKIDLLRDRDPLMYWKRMLSRNPGLSFFSDYIAYLEKRKAFGLSSDLFEGRIDVNSHFNKKYDYPSGIINRDIFYDLNSDGRGRVFVDELIYLKDERGIEKWGEYRVPFSGHLHSIRVRVYYSDGTSQDSYRREKVDENYYINISSLKKNSILHVRYIVDNPVETVRGSSFIIQKPVFFQSYNEPVEKLRIKVRVPEKMKLSFFTSDSSTVKPAVLKEGNRKIYSFEKKNIDAVHFEQHSGSSLKNLYFFSFSGMKDAEDFCSWYRGLLKDKNLSGNIDLRKFEAASKRKKIEKVYDFISRDILLLSNVLYSPDIPDDIIYRKGGSVEDKVVLAKALLEKMDIISFIGFSREKYFPSNKDSVCPDNFNGIFLFVPLSESDGLWLDFSDQYYSAGTVSPGFEGETALVLLKQKYVYRKIRSFSQSSQRAVYKININENGNAEGELFAEFSGVYGNIRSYFRDKEKYEESVHAIFSSVMPSLNIKKYSLKNEKIFSSPFVIKAEATGFGIGLITGNSMILQPVQNKSSIYNYIRYSKRSYDLYISSPVDEREEYFYTLPPGYEKFKIKRSYKVDAEFGSVNFLVEKKAASPVLKVIKYIKLQQGYISPSEYGKFLKFCMDLKKIEFQNLVIKKMTSID